MSWGGTARRVSSDDAHLVSEYVELVAQLDAVARALTPETTWHDLLRPDDLVLGPRP